MTVGTKSKRAFRMAEASMLLLVVVSCLSFGCAKPSGSEAVTRVVQDGGQDPGGGNAGTSTDAQVRAAFDRALALALEPEPRENIYFNYVWSMMKAGHSRRLAGQSLEEDLIGQTPERKELVNKAFKLLVGVELRCLLPPESVQDVVACNGQDLPGDSLSEKIGQHLHFVPMMSKSKIRLPEDGDCSVATNHHADASVSSHRPGAEICFSLKKLRRLPPQALLGEFLSLIFHEAAHLGGLREADAQALQFGFAEYFAFRFGALSDMSLRRRTAIGLGVILEDIDTALDFVYEGLEHGNSRRHLAFSQMNRAVQVLASLPGWQDTLGLQIMFDARTSEQVKAINAYSNSVMNALIYLRIRFHAHTYHSDCLPDSSGKELCAIDVNDEHLDIEIEKAKAMVLVVVENWKAVIHKGGKYTCIAYPQNTTSVMWEELVEIDSPRLFFGERTERVPKCN